MNGEYEEQKKKLPDLEGAEKFYEAREKRIGRTFLFSAFLALAGAASIAAAVCIALRYGSDACAPWVALLGGLILEALSFAALIVYRTSISQLRPLLEAYRRILRHRERIFSDMMLLDRPDLDAEERQKIIQAMLTNRYEGSFKD